MPLAFCVTPGQAADSPQAIGLLEKFNADYALLDKAYDANAILEYLEKSQTVAVIPAKKNRKSFREHDTHLYKERHKVECTFGWLKNFRRIFSRFDKTKKRFSDFFAIAAALIRMRYLNMT